MNSLSQLAFVAFLAQASRTPCGDAFTPTSFSSVNSVRTTVISPGAGTLQSSTVSVSRSVALNLSSSGSYLGMDDDDEEEDDDEDDDDEDELELSSAGRYSDAKSPFTGLKLDPWDPNPLLKPRPSRYFRKEDELEERIPDDQLQQTMSEEERKENLAVMRQIRKSDLPDLRMRKDHAGWVEANNDLKRRYQRDPWFGVNERLRDAIQLGEPQEKVDYLKDLAAKMGGPPPGIDMGSKEYAVHTEIYDIGISASRASSMLENEIRAERAARGRAMMAERRKNMEKAQQQFEEDMRFPGLREDREAKERRERVMRRLMSEIEEDQKKKRERAKEILGKLPETPESRTKSMEKALNEAREEMKKIRRKQLGKDEEGLDDDGAVAGVGAKSGGSAARAREAAAAEAAGGRPRLPGDEDVTRGEISTPVEPSSTTVTGPLEVKVSSVYNNEQSDPPMRKHCFQYTIKITNNSPTDTIQLLGRRFEIQTVGSSMKDVVQGEGVTGRTPILKPGETFEYTSTAPLSVRPIGTTIIAARMRGEYRYVVLENGQETATEEQIKNGGNETADLGTFHFIFPEDQRVKPFRADEDDEEEEEEEDDDDPKAVSTVPKEVAKPASTPSAAPSSTLPGDDDMKTGDIAIPLNDSSEEITDNVKVSVTSSYRPERSDASQDKHCFAYNIRITNESENPIQLVSRRFEIQTVGLEHKDVVQGPGVTGRQPILKPGESFEYTSTAPLNVKPMLDKTPVVARMQGEYDFVILGDDGTTPLSSNPLHAKLGLFHFILPALSST
ncbi:ApaG domain containing protein [Nitzschia inconspicua]|uniref:ApaG domain containing protein n=1 Tax=Nitzschia inconspicua TaxID=303405 RepID=A0A9K3L0E6_9STRA|nr:ApaG domain containing protein [Nitzschia inconspicua]